MPCSAVPLQRQVRTAVFLVPIALMVQVKQSACECVCVRTIIFKLNDLQSRYLVHWFTQTSSKPILKVKFTG